MYSGIISAAVELGNKQIRNKLNKIRSHHYMGILLKLGKNKKLEFKKSEMKELLSNDEFRVFDDFLKRMRDLEIIESVGRENSGEYAFVNRLYFVYFLIIANLGNIISSFFFTKEDKNELNETSDEKKLKEENKNKQLLFGKLYDK